MESATSDPVTQVLGPEADFAARVVHGRGMAEPARRKVRRTSDGAVPVMQAPAGRQSQTLFDDAGRATQIPNYVTGTADPGHARPGRDRVRDSYTPDARLATLTAVNGVTGDQLTQYVYGTTLADSSVARSYFSGRPSTPIRTTRPTPGQRPQRRLQPYRVRVQPPRAGGNQAGPERHGPPVRLRRLGPPYPGLRDRRGPRRRRRGPSHQQQLRGSRPAAELNQLR